MFDLFGNASQNQSNLEFPTPLTEKYRPRTMAEFVGLRLQDRFLSRVKQVEFSSYGIAADAAALLQRIWDENTTAAAPNFARIVKESNNNVRESLMKLELELMLAS